MKDPRDPLLGNVGLEKVYSFWKVKPSQNRNLLWSQCARLIIMYKGRALMLNKGVSNLEIKTFWNKKNLFYNFLVYNLRMQQLLNCFVIETVFFSLFFSVYKLFIFNANCLFQTFIDFGNLLSVKLVFSLRLLTSRPEYNQRVGSN